MKPQHFHKYSIGNLKCFCFSWNITTEMYYRFMFPLNKPRASTSLTWVNYLFLYNHTALRYSVVWHCRFSFWDCVARIEMQYHNWIWLGIGVDTEALCIVPTNAGVKLLHSLAIGHRSSGLSSFPWLLCGFYSTRGLKSLSYVWRVQCSYSPTGGITQELLSPLHPLLTCLYCRWLSTVHRIQTIKTRQMRIVVKKYGRNKKVV
jgi:hypothetical protein